ncbi:DUF2334 domain-containing protein [Saccharopolyspora taberi]|uniref:DUF2334 domain-containing protein n=1 Tax=Saccharopolyspora taberi TaxID=60895 RepID=A0ABN3VKY5_9PSEU
MPLVVSLSGLDHRALDQCADFAAEMDRRRVPMSLLFAPRQQPDPQLLDWIRDRQRGQDTVELHGFGRGESAKRVFSRLARPAATLRGSESATIPAHEAGLRLLPALATLDRIGLRTGTFVPPRWFSSPGTLTALRRQGFEVCADALAIRELSTGQVHRARVHALGSSARAEPWWCRALVLGVARAARRGRLIRIAVDAAELPRSGPRQAVLDAVDLALHHGAVPTTYGAYAGPVRIPRPRTPENEVRNSDPLSS